MAMHAMTSVALHGSSARACFGRKGKCHLTQPAMPIRGAGVVRFGRQRTAAAVLKRGPVKVCAIATPPTVPATNGNGAAVGAPAPAPAPPLALPPPAVFKAIVGASKAKAAYPLMKTLVLSFSAGALIGIGALLCTHVGGSSPALAAANPGLCDFLKGAVGLPVGLALVVLTGAELFTGNVMVMLAGYLNKTVTAGQAVKNWLVSYMGNFVGSLFLAYLSFCACTMAAPPFSTAAVKIATGKATLPFGVAFAKGILCNWLVCLAVWCAMASNTIMGKLGAIWFPISTFICLGFEHSVANMFIIPQGMLAGASITWSQFIFGNLVPVTLGNIVGAAIFVVGIHHIAYAEK